MTLRIKLYAILCIFMGLMLSACSSTTKKELTFTPAAAPEDKAAVYIYRQSAISNVIYSPDLYVNDEFKLSLKDGKNTRLILEAGNYDLKIEPDKNYDGITHLSLATTKGRTYYIQVTTSLKINSSTNYQPYQRSFNLIEVDEAVAIQQIADCCQKENSKNTTSTKSKAAEDHGFSVDKTQNPFSH